MQDCEDLKAAGNAAIKARNFQAAEEHYTQALSLLGQSDASCHNLTNASMYITLLCNRSQARHSKGDFKDASSDAAKALDLLPEGGANTDIKMRVKALYRRALSLEALGDLRSAYHDVNLALKLAPANEGLLVIGKRLKAGLPSEPPSTKVRLGSSWVGSHAYNNCYIARLADSNIFPNRLRGYSGSAEDPVVRFGNGIGVSVYYPDGVLRSIQAFGKPEVANRETVNLYMKDFHLRPNFPMTDEGFIATYSREGDLQCIMVRQRNALNGPAFTFYPTGLLEPSKCGVYVDGQLDSSIVSQDLHSPASIIARTLVELAIPVKKSLDIDLSPGEQKLCDDLRISADSVTQSNLNYAGKASVEHSEWLELRKKQPLSDNLLVIGGELASYPELPENLAGDS